jgi:hypothetical protein
MEQPRRFEIPPEEDPEPGVPATLQHGCDYMLVPRDAGGTRLEYHYNFLDYAWIIEGRPLSARHYLDEPGTVSVMIDFATFDQPAFAAVLRFLQRRYATIEATDRGPDGPYVVRWRNRHRGDGA